MGGIQRPRPGFLCGCMRLKIVGGRQVWTNEDRSSYFTWDGLHGEIEAFDKKGRHTGSLDSKTGALIKDAVKGRRLDV